MDEKDIKLAIFAAVLSLFSALFAAIYVDYRARWREKRAAAMVVIGELKAFEIFAEAMAALRDLYLRSAQSGSQRLESRISQGQPSPRTSVFLPAAEAVLESVRVRPQLSDLFMQSAGRIMDTDDEFVWAHINVFIQAALAAQRLLNIEVVCVEAEVGRLSGPTRTSPWPGMLHPNFNFEALNPRQLQQAAKHARYARKHIDAVILSRCASHNRVLRMAWTPEMREKRYLEEGLREEGGSTEMPKPDPCDGTA